MMVFSDALANEIVLKCLDVYNSLPKTGKPLHDEWTVLSCIVQHNLKLNDYVVVSLGTGTKCSGTNKMSAEGNTLNDSHAEVIARRGFLVYLYHNIVNALTCQKSIFIYTKGRFRLRPGIQFIFYSSQMPCGDASIMPKTEDNDYGVLIESNKREASEDLCDVDTKREKLSEDNHRTGAKCLPGCDQDPKGPGVNYHITGQVRTKPGRGVRTLSVSCSDKMARWIRLGIQGGLLDMLLTRRIYIKHFIIGGGVPYSHESLRRALLNRNGPCKAHVLPTLRHSNVSFPDRKYKTGLRAAPTTIIMVNIKDRILEYSVQGRKLGVINSKAEIPSNYLSIHKYSLYKRFQDILLSNHDTKSKLCGDDLIQNIPYNEMKLRSRKYQKSWKIVLKNIFKIWTVKPDMWNFCVK